MLRLMAKIKAAPLPFSEAVNIKVNANVS